MKKKLPLPSRASLLFSAAASSCAVLLALVAAGPAAAAPGDLDTTFSTDGRQTSSLGANLNVTDAVEQPDGKIVVVGRIGSGLATKALVARYTAAGVLDPTFGTGGKVTAFAGTGTTQATGVALQPDGKILICGTASISTSDFFVMRFHANGTLDTTFDTDGKVMTDFGDSESVYDIALAPSGKIIVVGYTEVSGGGDYAIACYNSNGSPDTGFDTDGKVIVSFSANFDAAEAVAVLPDGRMMVAGYSSNGTDFDFSLLRLLANGALDTAFDTDGRVVTDFSGRDDRGHAMCVQPNGDIIVAGESVVTELPAMTEVPQVALARYRWVNGALDATFGTGGKFLATTIASEGCAAKSVALQPDGKILVGGYAVEADPNNRDQFLTLRFTVGGSLDPTFSGDGIALDLFGFTDLNAGCSGSAVLWQGSGRILTVGEARASNSATPTIALVRYQGEPVGDLSVETPALTFLWDGISTVDYGVQLPSAAVTKTFTIRNTGAAALNFDPIPVTVTGANAADFIITQPAVNPPLAPGLTRTFTVKLGPVAAGTKTATLHVGTAAPGEDPDEDTFDIALKAEVSNPVFFESPGYAVVEGSSITLKVKRQAAGGAVTVNVKSTGGTAAVGTHYTMVNETKTFADGSAEETVNFTALDNGLGDVTKTVILTLSGGTAPKGAAATLTTTVRIIDKNSVEGVVGLTDTVPPPAATVSTPANNALVPVVTGGTVTITGTATDARAVKAVEVSINNLAYVPATLAAPGATSTAYTATVVPVGGSATAPFSIRVRTTDYAGLQKESPVAPARTFRVSRPLLVSAGAGGTVVAGFASSSFREPGTSVTITATPAVGKLFSRWLTTGTGPVSGLNFATPANYGVIGITEGSRELPKLTFTMQEGLVLQATFVDNLFATTASVFNGLVTTETGVAIPGGLTAPGNHTEGSFTATVQPTGGFSGKITMDGLDLNVAGVFDPVDLEARFGTTRARTVNVLRPGKPALVLALVLRSNIMGGPYEGIIGTVVQNYRTVVTARSNIGAMKKYYTGAAPFRMPVEFLGSPTTFTDGRVTAYFPIRSLMSQPAALLDEMYYPQGHGYMSMTVSKAGLCTYSGRLADGTIFSGSTTATLSGTSIYAPLYIPLFAKQGCFTTFLGFDPALGEVVNVGPVRWFRPYQDAQHYPDGWAEGLALDVKGAVYKMEAGKSVLDSTTTENRSGDTTFTWGLLPSPITYPFSATRADVVSDNDLIFTTNIARTTGVITGNFEHDDGSTQPYYGVIYQKGANPRGFGCFLSPTPAVKTYDGEAGKVELTLD